MGAWIIRSMGPDCPRLCTASSRTVRVEAADHWRECKGLRKSPTKRRSLFSSGTTSRRRNPMVVLGAHTTQDASRRRRPMRDEDRGYKTIAKAKLFLDLVDKVKVV